MSSPKQYRKKPVVIEAWQFKGMMNADEKGSLGVSNLIDWILSHDGTARWHQPEAGQPEYLAIDTLEGTMRADVGDWIVRGTRGEFYPVKPDRFADTYESAEVQAE